MSRNLDGAEIAKKVAQVLNQKSDIGRRDFLRLAALSAGTCMPIEVLASEAAATDQSAEIREPTMAHSPSVTTGPPSKNRVAQYPPVYRGRELKMIAYPLGGVAAGSIGLGGRGQLRDWEIANRPDKGNAPQYGFASINISNPEGTAITRVLESQIEEPYEGSDGLGSRNVPGLPRLSGATFRGEFPLAHIDFHDDAIPVSVCLDAGTPFIPLDADASGLPCAVLKYTVRNPTKHPLDVSIAFSLENPVISSKEDPSSTLLNEGRVNEIHEFGSLTAVQFRNERLSNDDEDFGTFALGVIAEKPNQVTVVRGWPAGRWWNSVLLFWDDFRADGKLGPESPTIGHIGAVCQKQTIAPASEAAYTFLLGWHYPNRTPARCGWYAPAGLEHSVIGNWYATRFANAWDALKYTAEHLPTLEERTDKFLRAMRDTTLPSFVKEAATSNISTLTRQTFFRTADGNFYGFEGCNDHLGSCPGNSTSVFNYQVAIEHLFPACSRSMRASAFGPASDERGCMDLRQLLPAGIGHRSYAAADGQMAQVMKVYLDWQISGDTNWLRSIWPKVKRCIEFAWVPGGWDANRDGVMEGAQNNTYDTEFIGPNPLCGLWYLGALRAAQAMASALGDAAASARYDDLFSRGSSWIDNNLFNGEFYIQRIGSLNSDQIAQGLSSNLSVSNTEHPDSQVGEGCLIDQVVGQYMSDLCGLGPLVKPDHLRKTLHSIYRLNHKENLGTWECFARTFALNGESALVICDYRPGTRPLIPFPYFSEVMTGFEYSVATLMLSNGMVQEGLATIRNVRSRFDGVKRNPWDESEAGHHYIRAMAAWSCFLVLSGFRYAAPSERVTAAPLWKELPFHCFWSSGSGWGTFSLDESSFSLTVSEGEIAVREAEFSAHSTGQSSANLQHATLEHSVEKQQERVVVTFTVPVVVKETQTLVLKV
jgi:non-lysosomal glucosylceramidase